MNFAKYSLNKRVLAFLAAGVVGLLAIYLMPFSGLLAQTQAPVYADTPADAWYYEYVADLQSRGIFEGTECDEGFCPNQPLPRWQMAVWMIRALEEAKPAAVSSRFADIEVDVWWMPYTERLADLGITVGCKSEPLKYCPDRAVSRAQMATFLYRAFSLPEAEAPAGFEDVLSDHWAASYINALAASGITVGCKSEPLRYCPSRSVTRAQMATFIYRGLKWQEAQAEEKPEFITEENELSHWVKHAFVDEYGDQWTWLKEVWDYTNREDFEYAVSTESLVGFDILEPEQTGDAFYKITAYKLQIREEIVGNPYYLHGLANELAHIYILGHGVAREPMPVALGWLYFESIAENCPAHELYAETAEFIVSDSANATPHWRGCPHLPDTPTAEAIDVVSEAFAGRTPDWFYDTFQKPNGSLNYEKLWTAVKNSPATITVPMLRNAFGGYCSEEAVWDTTFVADRFERPPLIQPWRDGGC